MILRGTAGIAAEIALRPRGGLDLSENRDSSGK
jgi:hypothetical protein